MMALFPVGLALGVYVGTRTVERLHSSRRRCRLLRHHGHGHAADTLDMATALRTKRTELHAASWALGLCLGRYVLPVLTPAALVLTIYSMLPLLRASERAFVQQQRISSDLVNATVCIGSLGLGLPLGAAVQCWIFQVADVAVCNSRERARRLLTVGIPEPAAVRVVQGEQVMLTAVAQLQPGDCVVLAAGEAAPIDGRVVTGSLRVDQQRLTGESAPLALGTGDPVYAGTLVLRGEAQVEITQAGSDTTLARMERVLRDSLGHHTQLQLKAEAVADAAALPLLGASVLIWPLIGPSAAVALLFSAPINAVRAAGALAVSHQVATLLEQGILIKDGRALEALAEIDTVLFDKTGTLTADALRITEVTVTGNWKLARVLATAAAAEGRVTHPLAQTLQAAAQKLGCEPLEATETDYRVGFGVSAIVDGEQIWLGGRRHLEALGLTIDAMAHTRLAAAEERGETTLLLANPEGIQGLIHFAAQPRAESAEVVRFLAEHGIDQVALVSGDHESSTQALAQTLGIDQVYSNVLPEEKAALVAQLQAEGRRVCFIGDGVNDALAMRTADCAISLHGASELATDAASILLLDGSLHHLPTLLTAARAQQAEMRGVLTYWGGYGVVNLGLNVGLRWGVLPSSLFFGAAFGSSFLWTKRRRK